MGEKAKKNPAAKHIWIRAFAALIILCLAVWILFLCDESAYLWIKAMHVVAIICWMAGMLYLPRLFIYHCDAPADSAIAATFKIMEQRLLHYIINPAMLAAWGTGLWLAWKIYHFHGGWLHLKLAAVILLSGFHGFLSASMRRFSENRNIISQKAWRMLNEVPTILLIIAVIAVIVKPF